MDKYIIKSNVVLVTSDEKSKSFKWEENSEKIKAIDVISSDYGWDENDFFQGNKFIGLIPNTEQVFLKSPFEQNKFVEIEKAEEYFLTKKISIYKNIIFALGAKDFSAKAEFIEEKEFTKDADFNVSYMPIGGLSAEYKEETIKKIESEYKLSNIFEDNENNDSFDRTRAYNEAMEIVHRYNLTNEDQLLDLVEFRNPKAQKKLSTETVQLKLTSELNTLLELSAKINVMDGVFGLEAGFKTKTKSLKKIILTTVVNF
ncbi:hypothetical protein [Flavobacterium sp. N1994]|uniref:hypothetical protein n=1 Tax=Flavobacterium sp. N1994 TaxID=2986827 RepID=UPI002222DD8C|nr:hypothetical protein [Flavobacterium sp. N1994]